MEFVVQAILAINTPARWFHGWFGEGKENVCPQLWHWWSGASWLWSSVGSCDKSMRCIPICSSMTKMIDSTVYVLAVFLALYFFVAMFFLLGNSCFASLSFTCSCFFFLYFLAARYYYFVSVQLLRFIVAFLLIVTDENISPWSYGEHVWVNLYYYLIVQVYITCILYALFTYFALFRTISWEGSFKFQRLGNLM